jgi:hypothetical protein
MLFYQILIFLLILISIFIVIVLIKVNTKRDRILRYFRHNAEIRHELVMNTSKNPGTIPEDISPQEMVSILTLISAKSSVFQAYHAALRFTEMNFEFTTEFYNQLENLARTFSARHWMLESQEILRLGEMIAHKLGDAHWAEEYRSYINSITYVMMKRKSSLKIF